MSDGSKRYTSQVFDILRALKSDMDGLSFPDHLGYPVVVKFGDPYTEPEDPEFVHVVQVSDTNQEWARTSPAGRDETISTEIICGSFHGGRTGEDVLDRLEMLSDIIHDKYYDRDTRQFNPVDIPAVVKIAGIVGVDVQIYPGTSGGYVGTATIRMQWVVRI
jgi:hypothetical protein